MPSSTSHHGSLNTRLLGVLLIGLLGAPLVWLTMLQTGYVLAYQACDDRSNSWVLVPALSALALAITLAAISARATLRANRERIPLPFVGHLAIGMSALMVIVLAASAIAPILLRPCD
jgi:hypothetical protein